MKNIVLIGPQGSGKGTQAAMIKKEFNIPNISTGELFRENIRNKTELGRKAKAIIDRGNLVPDDLTNNMAKERLSRPDCKKGFLLDGFPRTLPQAKALDKFAKINIVLEIHIDDKLAIKRLSNRRQCKNCGAIFGIGVPPKVAGKCDKCNGELYQRDDDRPEAIKKRLAAYKKETVPILDFYRKKGVLIKLDGSKNLHKLFEEIKKKVIEFEKPKPAKTMAKKKGTKKKK